MDMVVCPHCGEPYIEAFFKPHRVGVYTRQPYRRILCRGCLQTQRDKKKRSNRPLEKARLAYRHHARKFVAAGIINQAEDLGIIFGWNLRQMAHDIEHSSKNGCPYCHQLFLDMEHGLAAITLDIVNPELLPYYTTNVRWVCRTCNTEKQRTNPEDWGAICQAWAAWRRRQVELRGQEYIGELFETAGVRYAQEIN